MNERMSKGERGEGQRDCNPREHRDHRRASIVGVPLFVGPRIMFGFGHGSPLTSTAQFLDPRGHDARRHDAVAPGRRPDWSPAGFVQEIARRAREVIGKFNVRIVREGALVGACLPPSGPVHVISGSENRSYRCVQLSEASVWKRGPKRPRSVAGRAA